MWFYTADTVTRVTSTRRPPMPQPRPARTGSVASHRVAGVLRSLADRIDTHPTREPATGF